MSAILAAVTPTARHLAEVPSVISVLVADPELGTGIPEEELALARRAVVAPALHVPAGPWEPEPLSEHERGAFALLVVEGLLTREVRLGGRRATQLVGPGDVIAPGTSDEGLLPVEERWIADEVTTLAVLDRGFLAAQRRWPVLGLALHRRMATAAARLSVHAAIAQLGRVELRTLALLWHLAERWGVVTRDGVALPLHLTHAALGRLIGAQRPTVTLALTELASTGDVTRRADGAFLLRPGSQDLLDPGRAAPVHAA